MTVKPLFPMVPLMRLSAILTAALLAWGLWYWGIGWFNGREGLDWLNGFQWGALPACAAIAAACAAAVAPGCRPWRISVFLLLATALCLAAFAGARDELYGGHAATFEPPGLEPLIRLTLYWVCVSAGLAWLAGHLLAPMRWLAAPYLAGALIVALFAGYLTVTAFPGGRHPDYFNAIRLGYPVLWTALLVPAALRLGRKPPGDGGA